MPPKTGRLFFCIKPNVIDGVQLNLLRGFKGPHHCDYPSLIAWWRRIVRSLATIFMLPVTEITVMLTC